MGAEELEADGHRQHSASSSLWSWVVVSIVVVGEAVVVGTVAGVVVVVVLVVVAVVVMVVARVVIGTRNTVNTLP